MDNPQSDATRLNTEVVENFNLQLKLQQFPMAEISATTALLRDARFYKARYRRALARQKQGRLMEALVDLANVLTVEPLDKVAAAAVATISREHEDSGRSRGFLSPMSILKADYPSAYCAPRSNPDPVQQTSAGRPAGGIVVPNSSSRIPKALRLGTCASCKTVKSNRTLKTCRGVGNVLLPFPTFLTRSFVQCGTAIYCNEECQRNHWATHKKLCVPYDDDDVIAIHLCRTLLDHKFIRMQILIYAMRAIGALHHNNPVFLAFVKMVPLTTGPSKRRRVFITNIVTVPLAVLEKDTRDSYVTQLQQTRETCKMPNAPGVAILVTSHQTLAKEAANSGKGRTLIFMHRVVPEIVLMAKQSMLAIGFESHSFGTSPKVTTDLDELYWILEDELANDVDNYYGLQC
ncbi:hypothetical protein DFH09DRAFT_1073009 [Mycena vulgaris]|nr:hypothetical protein DFH09DRAFT_1073009 [Mycena vulgaris]